MRQDLVDSHIFIQARSILEGLAQNDCSAALAWCEENRTRLKRLKSKLEFKLRVQVGLPYPIVNHRTHRLPTSLFLHNGHGMRLTILLVDTLQVNGERQQDPVHG